MQAPELEVFIIYSVYVYSGYQTTPRRVSTQPFSLVQVDDLKEALQEMFKTSGVKGTPLLFLMTDGQIVNERFLIYINDILANGWISDLFPKVSFIYLRTCHTQCQI